MLNEYRKPWKDLFVKNLMKLESNINLFMKSKIDLFYLKK